MQAEIDRAHEKQSEASKGTLRQIFPGVDEEVLGWVLEESEGQLERSIETLLEMTGGGWLGLRLEDCLWNDCFGFVLGDVKALATGRDPSYL